MTPNKRSDFLQTAAISFAAIALMYLGVVVFVLACQDNGWSATTQGTGIFGIISVVLWVACSVAYIAGAGRE